MKAKRLILSLIAFYLIGTALISGYYWHNHQFYVQTEDARAKADLTVLKTPITGQIASLQIRENQEVEANEVIGFVRAATASASPGTRVPLIAPASGRVLRMGVQEGEVVTSGQNLLAIADLETTYVEARLTETEVSRVRIGQTVNVSLDTAAGKTVTGVVSMIEGVTQQAVWPIVSLIPARQQPKEEELVPVRIKVKQAHLIPGTHVSVKINVRGASDALF